MNELINGPSALFPLLMQLLLEHVLRRFLEHGCFHSLPDTALSYVRDASREAHGIGVSEQMIS